MPQKFVYDYYDVHIPRDAVPEDVDCEFENQDIFNIAYMEAQRRTRIYAMPCTWSFQLIDDTDSADYLVRVCRKRCKLRRPHFHVLVGMPGYMPESNYVCRTRGDAEHQARWAAEDFRETGYHRDWEEECQGKVVGNKSDGYEVLRYALGEWEVYMTIRISQCYEEDCLEELEE